MGEHGEHGDADDAAGIEGNPRAGAPSPVPGEFETKSLYDSLLRAVAAGAPSVHIETEVGPHD